MNPVTSQSQPTLQERLATQYIYFTTAIAFRLSYTTAIDLGEHRHHPVRASRKPHHLVIAMDELRSDIEVRGATTSVQSCADLFQTLGEGRPKFVFLLKTLGLVLVWRERRVSFLRTYEQGPPFFLHDDAFWERKLREEPLLKSKTVPQVQHQIRVLLHTVVDLAEDKQPTNSCQLDHTFKALQNAYLILIALGLDVLPVGALGPFEPWEVVKAGLLGSLYDISDHTLSYSEQVRLSSHLERQYHRLRRLIPIRHNERAIVRSHRSSCHV